MGRPPGALSLPLQLCTPGACPSDPSDPSPDPRGAARAEGTPSPGRGRRPLLRVGAPSRRNWQRRLVSEAAPSRGFPQRQASPSQPSRGGDAPGPTPTPAGRASPVAECQVAGVTQPIPCGGQLPARQPSTPRANTCTGPSVAVEEEAAVQRDPTRRGARGGTQLIRGRSKSTSAGGPAPCCRAPEFQSSGQGRGRRGGDGAGPRGAPPDMGVGAVAADLTAVLPGLDCTGPPLSPRAQSPTGPGPAPQQEEATEPSGAQSQAAGNPASPRGHLLCPGRRTHRVREPQTQSQTWAWVLPHHPLKVLILAQTRCAEGHPGRPPHGAGAGTRRSGHAAGAPQRQRGIGVAPAPCGPTQRARGRLAAQTVAALESRAAPPP